MHQSLDTAWQDLQSGKYRRALKKFQESIEVKDVDSQAYSGLAWCYNALSQPEQASMAARKALELDPHLVDPHIILASAYTQMHRFNESAEEIQKALKLDPNSAHAHHVLGLQLLDKEQFDEAIEHLKRAITIKPEHSSFHISIAMAYQKMGHRAAAVREYKYALESSRSFETTVNVILSFVGNYRQVLAILSLLPVFIRSIYTLPVMLITVGYIALIAWLSLRRGKYMWGIGAIVVCLLLIAFYVYLLLYGR